MNWIIACKGKLIFHTIFSRDSPRKSSCNIVKLNFSLVLISAPTTLSPNFVLIDIYGLEKQRKDDCFFLKIFFFPSYFYSMTCNREKTHHFYFNHLKKCFRTLSYRVRTLNWVTVTKPWTNLIRHFVAPWLWVCVTFI